jgi:ATP-binding cassette subfamily B protein
MAMYDAAKYINEGLFHILVLGMSIWLATTDTISTGDILTYSMLFISVVTPLREIHRILDEAHESSIRVLDFFDLMDLPEDISFAAVPAISKISLCEKEPAVKISGLNFTYPGACEPTIDNLDLVIQAGEFIGICGPTGSGKSTILKILLRLIHAQHGNIFLLGLDLNSMTREDLARMVGYISQNAFLVSGTVFDNIAYGMDNVPPEEVEEAARKANIHKEIVAFPEGYYTQVGERGSKLSGGQRQRIALARVFLQSPSLLILDEATAALDNLNEKVVQEAIEEAMIGKTVIAVAHRLTTLRNADRILVFDKGRVVESGTYHDLLEAGGLFTHLAQASMDAKGRILFDEERDRLSQTLWRHVPIPDGRQEVIAFAQR